MSKRFDRVVHGMQWLRPIAYGVTACLVPSAAMSQPAADQPTSPTSAPGVEQSISETARLSGYDKQFGMRGWNIPFPSFADTIGKDTGNIRTTLGSYGLGFEGLTTNNVFDNVLDTPRKINGRQAFIGQQLTATTSTVLFATMDLSRYGIPDGQIAGAGAFSLSTFPSFVPRTASLGSLSYYQTMFDRTLAIKAGYLSNGEEFVGAYVGGSLTGGVFGPSASIPYELGLSSEPAPAPGVNLTINIPGGFYSKLGIQRSLIPDPNVFRREKEINTTGFRLSQPGAGGLFLDEIGYKQEAAPGQMQTWLRAAGMFNSSRYFNYRTGGRSTNVGAYALADRQLLQLDPSSPFTAFRGIYAGVSAMYAAPDTNVFTAYFEGRVYAFGLFSSRPFDLASVVYTHSEFSKYARRQVDSVSALTNTFAERNSDSVTMSYAARLLPGVYATPALSYTHHPSFVYVSPKRNALNVQGNLTLLF